MATAQASDEPTAALLTACSPASLPTVVPGSLTLGTGPLPAPPWFNDADPAGGQGLAASIGAALSRQLGYPPDRLRWVGPGVAADANFDFDPAAARSPAPAAEPSVGYFAVNDAVVINRTRTPQLPAGRSTRLGYVRGQQSEWTSQTYGAKETVAFDSEIDGLAALSTGRIDAMLVPLTSTTSLAPPLVAVAQVPPGGAYQAQQLTLAMPVGSPLTACVNGALDRLRIEGALAAEAQRWIPLPTVTKAP